MSVSSGAGRGPGGARGDRRRNGRGVPGLWGGVHLGEGPCRPRRRTFPTVRTNCSAVEQDPLAMPGGLLRARLVHRGHRAGPGPGAHHRAVARPDRRGDRRRGPFGDRGRRYPWGVVADRAPRLRRPRRGAAGRARAGPSTRYRRDPPRKAQVGILRRHRPLGAGRPVGHRVRRPRRRTGPAGAARRPHRRDRGRLAVRAHAQFRAGIEFVAIDPAAVYASAIRTPGCCPTRRWWSITSTWSSSPTTR